MQATGEPRPATAWIDPPTPVLAEMAPAPESVLATLSALTGAPAVAGSRLTPPPGQIPLARRGRRGDRGAGLLRAPLHSDTVTAPVASALVADAAADGQPVSGDSPADGESGEGRRKRRRRRRRGRRGEGETDTTLTGAPGPTGDDDDDSDDEPERAAASGPVAPATTSGTAGPSLSGSSESDTHDADGDARRKRRRRRRGGARPPETLAAPAPAAPLPFVPPPLPIGTPVAIPRRIAQDEIIIDIDESEMELVQSEFGDLDDEFDEFALMDRRQAVIETLQEDTDLEDVSRSDARRAGPVEVELEVDDDDDSDEGDDEGDEPDAAPAVTTTESATDEAADAPGVETDSDDDRKRKRRRRRKKVAPVALPELTAPPHKDFWEVWATKFTYQDFEDGKYTPPNDVPEVEEAPPAPVPVDRPARQSAPRSAPSRGPRPGSTREPRGDYSPPPARTPPPPRPVIAASAEQDDADFGKVCLNLGRSHGHKAATIRALLRDHLGLEGRAIRDLTVRDADTLFRVHADELPRIQEALAQVREGDTLLTISPAGDNRADDLRAPPPDAEAPRAAEPSVMSDERPAEHHAPQGEEAPANLAASGDDPGDAQTIALDPLEFTDAPRVGDEAGNT